MPLHACCMCYPFYEALHGKAWGGDNVSVSFKLPVSRQPFNQPHMSSITIGDSVNWAECGNNVRCEAFLSPTLLQSHNHIWELWAALQTGKWYSYIPVKFKLRLWVNLQKQRAAAFWGIPQDKGREYMKEKKHCEESRPKKKSASHQISVIQTDF